MHRPPIDSCIQIFWESDEKFYEAIVLREVSLELDIGWIHEVRYADGMVETLDLRYELWKPKPKMKAEQHVEDGIAGFASPFTIKPAKASKAAAHTTGKKRKAAGASANDSAQGDHTFSCITIAITDPATGARISSTLT